MKILMVCLGNICRSPLAEGIMARKIEENGLPWEVDSAGTNGYHVGEAPHRLSQKVATANGLDISRQCARRFSAADMQQFDLIYAMAEDVIIDMKRIAGRHYIPEKVKLLMEEAYPGENRDVPDPWYGEESGYHDVYRMMQEACEKSILRLLNREEF